MQVSVELRYRLMDMRIAVERDPDQDPAMCVLHIEWYREQGPPESDLAVVGRPDDLRALAQKILSLLDQR